MPRGASPKREHEYEELVNEFKKQDRYEDREEEVAARIVNKQRAEHSETQGAKAESKAGHAPDRDLPLKNYDHLTVTEIVGHLDELNAQDVKHIESYEKQHHNRKTLLDAIERHRSS